MSLSPDEERRFNAIVAELARGRVVRIPWPAVAVSIVLVGVLALSAVFLGLGAGLALLPGRQRLVRLGQRQPLVEGPHGLVRLLLERQPRGPHH